MSELKIRLAVRALVVDENNRVLLVKFDFPRWQGWVTPGGGTDGEENSVALGRELLEETGLTDYEMGPMLWDRTAYSPYLSTKHDGQREFVYHVPCKHFEVTPSMTVEELASEGVVDHRWWTIEELEASSEAFRPRDLPQRVRRLLDEGPPSEPDRFVEAG